jgi:hypothetical protein
MLVRPSTAVPHLDDGAVVAVEVPDVEALLFMTLLISKGAVTLSTYRSWLEAPLQLHTWTCAPLFGLKSLTSRHLLFRPS